MLRANPGARDFPRISAIGGMHLGVTGYHGATMWQVAPGNRQECARLGEGHRFGDRSVHLPTFLVTVGKTLAMFS